MRITQRDVDTLALGCELLGSGGGGSTSAARLILRHHLGGRPPVPLVHRPSPRTPVVCVGAVGAPALMLEDLPSPAAFTRAVAVMDRHGRPAEAIFPLEVGGVNGLLAVLAAAALGVPLIDADPMGRAYTHLHRSVLGRSTPATALAFAGRAGEAAYFEANDASALERMVRSILPSAGGWGVVAWHAGEAGTVLRHAVPRTVSRALGLGAALAAAIDGDPGVLTGRDDVHVGFEGTVVEVTRRPGIEVGGAASIQHSRLRAVARLDFANEYVALYDNGDLVACAPELLCVVDARTWRPIAVDRLDRGHRIRILVIDAPPSLRDAHRRLGEFGLVAHGFAPVGANR